MLNPFVKVGKFETFFNPFHDGVADSLVDEFRNNLSGITSYDVGQRLAELFKNILSEAARLGRGRMVTSRNGSSAKGKYGSGLVMEATRPND